MAGESARSAARWPLFAAWTVAALNAFDGLFTLSFLQAGRCEEANPVMRALYLCSPALFLAVKLVTVTAAAWLLAHLRVRASARLALALGAVVYVALAAYELSALTLR